MTIQKKKTLTNIHRTDTGSMLLLSVIVLFLVVVPVFVLACQLGLYSVDRLRTQSAVEAAGLVAANDLSRIIIDDPNFGYVALSNYPPIGKGTLAEDGEPLPVLGINTLVGTIRQNTIIARELNNATMATLAEKDRLKMESTIDKLNATISSAIVNRGRHDFSDIHGKSVQPAGDVQAFLNAGLPAGVRLESVKLTNGWLEGGGDTTIALPQPQSLAQVKQEETRGGRYKAFVNIPAEKQPFTFAGVGPSSSLVSPADFRPADGKHINSIVKVECTVALDNVFQPLAPFGIRSCDHLTAVACCQPFAMAEIGPAGAMTLRFCGGPVTGMQCWRDFLNGGFHDNQITAYSAVGGDYPTNHDAHMIAGTQDDRQSTNKVFAEHLYYWLRNGHIRPRIDAVISMIDEPFRSGPAQIYAYEFARKGQISRRIITRDPFPIGVTAESQSQTIVDTNIQGGLSPIIVFRDDVANLGTVNGGQHAGQPLTGYPLNWCELTEYGGDEQAASVLEKGRLATGLSVVDPAGAGAAANGEDESANVQLCSFETSQGKHLALQPRKSFYSGGLALDIEIGGTGGGQTAAAQPAPSSPPALQAAPPVPLARPLPPILNVPNKLWIFAHRTI